MQAHIAALYPSMFLRKKVELREVRGYMNAKDVMWHNAIKRAEYLSKDVVLLAIYMSTWMV